MVKSCLSLQFTLEITDKIVKKLCAGTEHFDLYLESVFFKHRPFSKQMLG
jgi:hypothetical protein